MHPNARSSLRSSTALGCLAKPRASPAALSALQASLRDVMLTKNQGTQSTDPWALEDLKIPEMESTRVPWPGARSARRARASPAAWSARRGLRSLRARARGPPAARRSWRRHCGWPWRGPRPSRSPRRAPLDPPRAPPFPHRPRPRPSPCAGRPVRSRQTARWRCRARARPARPCRCPGRRRR